MRILSSVSGPLTRARSAVVLTSAVLSVTACDGGGDGLGEPAPSVDAGGPPDARVLPPGDAGPPDAPVPTLTRVSPSEGSVLGGTRVTLRGTAFSEPLEVWFGPTAAASVAWLDAQTLAATSPPGQLGPVAVRVLTDAGTAELPDAFTYVRELRLDEVRPARIPDEGGVELTLLGEGFTPETVVLLDRRPLRGLRVVDERTVRGYAPALGVGRPEIRVITGSGAVRRSDRLTVFGTPDRAILAPGYGPIGGGAEQELAGAGLADLSAVRFDGSAGEGLDVVAADRARVLAPATTAGVHDVELENADFLGRLPGAYVAYDPARADLHLLGVAPSRVPARTAASVTLVGGGFTSEVQVGIGLRRLAVRAATAHAVEVELPADLDPGPVTLELVQGGTSLSVPLVIEGPLAVSAVDPASGPASGETTVTIRGQGFAAGGDVEVRIGDVPLTDVSVIDDGTLTGRTVAGSHGPSDVRVRVGRREATLEKGFSFVEQFEIVRVEPRDGSVSGNTYVSIIGRGFDAPATVGFGEAPGVDPRLENGAILGVRTPPSPPGEVAVSVELASGSDSMLGGFSFFDPRLLVGGAWGGPIDGAVNVAVIDAEGAPVPGAAVQLGYDADPRYARVTDENGLATISSPEIRGAQTVSIGGEEREFSTFVDIDARNLTFRSSAFPQPPPEDQPPSPCPEPAQPPVVRGRIFELKSALDPETNPGVVPLVQITYSEANVFNPNPPMPPEQVDVVYEEGDAYEIVVMRQGTVAVYAILGDFDQATQTFTPRRMGIARGIPVAGDTVTEGIDIALDIEMDQTLRIRLDDPPDQSPGLNAVFPFLNLDSDGVIPFTASVVQPGGEVILENMPALPESQFFYMGGSFSAGAQGALQSPFSLTLLESNAPFDEGVDLGPFLEMPTNVRPKSGELFEGRRLSFDHGGPDPDLVTMSVGDSRVIAGQCCLDFNMNGTCEEDEPLQGGALPQPFTRWSLFAPGASQSFAFPPMPPGVEAFEVPRTYQVGLQLALVPRFSWEEFAYTQFSPFFWRSWVEWAGVFTVKEETD